MRTTDELFKMMAGHKVAVNAVDAFNVSGAVGSAVVCPFAFINLNFASPDKPRTWPIRWLQRFPVDWNHL